MYYGNPGPHRVLNILHIDLLWRHHYFPEGHEPLQVLSSKDTAGYQRTKSRVPSAKEDQHISVLPRVAVSCHAWIQYCHPFRFPDLHRSTSMRSWRDYSDFVKFFLMLMSKLWIFFFFKLSFNSTGKMFPVIGLNLHKICS